MRATAAALRATLAGAVIVAGTATVAARSSGQVQVQQVVLQLGANENSHDWRFDLTVDAVDDNKPVYPNPVDAVVRGPSEPLVLDISLDPACTAWQLRVRESTVSSPKTNPPDMSELIGQEYRRVIPSGGQENLHLFVGLWARAGGIHRQSPTCRVTFRLYKDVTLCKMSAQVTGDLSGAYFGDIAYFNYFPGGAPVTFGTAMDPMADLLGSVTSSGMNLREALRAWGAESGIQGEARPPGYGDKFGISLVGLTPPRGNLGDLFKALGALSSFSLAASSPGEEIGPWLAMPPAGAKATVTMPLSVVLLTPGARDGNLDGVKFIGPVGTADVALSALAPNAVIGRLVADLQSERQYDGRRLKVHVEAQFQALQGAYSCDLR